MSCKVEAILGIEMLFEPLLDDEYKRSEFHFTPILLLKERGIIKRDAKEEEVKCVEEKILRARAIASERSQFPPIPLFHRTLGRVGPSNLVSVPLIHQLTPRSLATKEMLLNQVIIAKG